MLLVDLFKRLSTGTSPTEAETFVKGKQRISKEAYAQHLSADDILLNVRDAHCAARYAHTLTLDGDVYMYTKAHFWVGGNARCYIGRGPGGVRVAIKEMRRTPYLYEDKKKATKPHHLTDSAIAQEYKTCMRLGMSLKPIAAACTSTKAYMILPLAHNNALDLATRLLPSQHAAASGSGAAGQCATEGFLLALLRDCCTHLSKIHTSGVVHNDVKMNNIVFCLNSDTGQGHFEMLDYGMSYDTSKGEYQGGNLFYGAPEVRGNALDALENGSDFERDCKRDSFSLGLSCMWLVLGGTKDFEALLPSSVCDTPQELSVAYRAFDYARQASVKSSDNIAEAYCEAWEAFRKRYPATATRYLAGWDKLHKDCSPELVALIAHLLAYDAQERWTAKQVLCALDQMPATQHEMTARQRCAQQNPHPIVQRHLDATYAALTKY